MDPKERNRVEWHEYMGLGEKQSELNKGKCPNQNTSRNVNLVKAAQIEVSQDLGNKKFTGNGIWAPRLLFISQSHMASLNSTSLL